MGRWLPIAVAAAALLPTAPARAGAPPVAERVTLANAADRLFGGSDADGGIDDWYLSNGIVEAIIDDVGVQSDVPPGVAAPPKQNEAAFTGGTILDLGRVGANDDQLAQMFTVAGLSTENFVLYDTIDASTTPTSATITVTGRALGFDPVLPEDLEVVTTYTARAGDPFLTIETTVTHQGADPAPMLGGFLDVFVWTDRAQLPFSPLPDRGFSHPALDLGDPIAALEVPAFAAAPGSLRPEDGVMDPETGSPTDEVSYGLLGVRRVLDEDGAGGSPPFVDAVADRLFGVTNHSITALGNVPVTLGVLVPGGVVVYERRVYVGDRNDVASVADPMLLEIAAREGFDTGTISGDVDARDAADVAASVIATRTAGPALALFEDGSPVTHFRTDASGAFAGVVLPVGTYDLEFRAVEREPLLVPGVAVAAAQDTAVAVPPLSGLGTLELEIVESVKGPDPRVPGKVVFLGAKGDPDPEFAKDVVAFELSPAGDEEVGAESFAGSLAQGRTVYLQGGTATVQLRPGRYELYASRGPEYTVKRRKVRVKEGRSRRAKFKLKRVVETPDALASDFHIHSGRSLDTQAAVEGRVVGFAGEGVEVMVSTDHDFHLDYAPVIQALSLEPWVTSIVGVEVTGSVPNPPAFPNSTGHINAWPVTVDAEARRDGAVEDEFVAPNWLFSRLRAAGAEVVQYNHPRAGVSGLTSIGIFRNIGCDRCANDVDQTCVVDADCPAAPEPQDCTCVGYQPDRALTEPPNDLLLSDDVTGDSGVPNPDGHRNIDFDLLEIGNGTGVSGYLESRADWFSLLNQANAPTPSGSVPVVYASGVSDSHRLTVESAGYFRSYVLGSGDDPASLDASAYDADVLAGRIVATTGPYLEVSLEDGAGGSAGVGETLVPGGGALTLHVRVQASNWVPVEEVRVVVNGAVAPDLVFDRDTRPGLRKAPKKPWSGGRGKVERFRAEIPLDAGAGDFWVVVEAGARLDPFPTPDPFASLLVPDWVSLAFTNPIFVDVAGDGFDAPGVSGAAAAQALAPLASEAGRAAQAARRAHDLRAHLPAHALHIPADAARRTLEALPEGAR